MENTVLVVEDNEINRELLVTILEGTYNVLEADNGKKALDILWKLKNKVSAVITDLIMPEMDGFQFLEEYSSSPELSTIPVIVSTSQSDSESEVKCLGYGAWDFIKKPYNAEIIRFRVKNVIERSELYVLRKLRYQEQFDTLTGIYIQNMFVHQTKKMLKENPDIEFMLLHFDIYQFQVYNSVFGRREGDKLICHIADMLRELEKHIKPVTYCRIEADVFGICMPRKDGEFIQRLMDEFQKDLKAYQRDYNILSNLGVFYIEDREASVPAMIDHAKLASKECKGSYIQNYYIYTEQMGKSIEEAQAIVNDMEQAMKEEQFVLYLQPKYSLADYRLKGAEVLIRWVTPDKGMVSPGKFIPVFEKNGLIMKLDYYVWEQSCRLIRSWLDRGIKPFPVSVNISRVSMYNPRMVEEIHELTLKYDVPAELFQLELTESAYTDNPEAIKRAMRQLQEYGHTILMDDFGSGYSSLNTLKDISVDVLKLDMKFMAASGSENQKRSESIVANVIRLAKDLDLPVIAEGVEEKEQVEFLSSVGCEYVQGYYFAKPMPVKEYETLAFQVESVFR
ncbi:MAG: EAL domain-containing protein [Lachnospiraceae bacterium]|nr:EAL domain-containing protein [Lachnospiraceae bacterium]